MLSCRQAEAAVLDQAIALNPAWLGGVRQEEK